MSLFFTCAQGGPKMKEKKLIETCRALPENQAGFDFIRYHVLEELLGNDRDQILYVLGKTMARKFDFESIDSMIEMFDQLGLGHLEHIKEKRAEDSFSLTSDKIKHRDDKNQEFRLEAGLLAMTIEKLRGYQCEATESVQTKKGVVHFSVKHYR